MATSAQATSTDVQLLQTSSRSPTLVDATLNGAAQSFIERVSPSQSRPSPASSNLNQTTGQPAPIGPRPPSIAIHHGANLILELIKAERKHAFEDAQRQTIHLQQQYNEHRAAYSRELASVSAKRFDAESMISRLSNERDRYLKEATDLKEKALEASAEAITARNLASGAIKAAGGTNSCLIAVRDALQQVGITVSQGDAETPNTLKIVLGAPWLELVSLDTPISDTGASNSDCSSSPHSTQALTSPSSYISFLRAHINRLIETLHTTQNSCKTLDSQRNQLQSDLYAINFDRTELESLKKEFERNEMKLSETEVRVTGLESEIHSLKKEREDAVKAKQEAVATLEEMKRAMTLNVNTLKSSLDQRLQNQQRQVEANAEKDRQALESSIEAKNEQIRDLQRQLAQSMATLDEWKIKYDAAAKERDSQQQLHVVELQKSKEEMSVQMALQIDDLQERLKDSLSKVLASENILKGKESRIEELKKELTSLRERHAKSSQDKDEAVVLVKSRGAQKKDWQDILVPSNRDVTTESAPKNNGNGSSVENKAGTSKSAAASEQLRFKTKHIPETHPVAVSTGDRQSKQTPAPKKVDKQKSKSSPLPGISTKRPLEIDSASSTDVEIIALSVSSQDDAASSDVIEIVSGPSTSTAHRAAAKPKLLRTESRKAPSGASSAKSSKAASGTSSIKPGDSVPPAKTSLKRAADVVDSPQAVKRPKLSLNASVSSPKDKVSSAAPNSPAPTPLESRSTTSSPIISGPGAIIDLRRLPALMSNSLYSGKTKRALASSNLRTPLSATSAEALSVGTSDGMQADVRHGSGSVASEAQNGPPQQLAANSVVPRTRLATAPTAGGSKKQTEFRNFNPSDAPAKEQPSVSLARPAAEQQQGAQAASSVTAPASAETHSSSSSSSSSRKSRPSLIGQSGGKDKVPTHPSNILPSSSAKHIPAKTADGRQDNPSRNSTPKSGISQPAGDNAKSSTTRPIPKGTMSSMAATQANQESSPKASWGPKSMSSTKLSGKKAPQGPKAPASTSRSARDLKKGTT